MKIPLVTKPKYQPDQFWRLHIVITSKLSFANRLSQMQICALYGPALW